ncbi:MAG: Hsp20/alpha crystallin family protein [Alphaproteobacteria bacterium]|nr:Hsp20/alpha crystallin family protein [Alphaproteobacteria bacterium]
MMLRDLIPFTNPRSLAERRRQDPFHAMQREMNRMMENMWGDFEWPALKAGEGGMDMFTPKMDVSETAKKITVTAELPGMEEKDVEVTFADGLLTIQGEHKEETEEKDEDKRYYMRECSYGSFRRVLPVGEQVKEDELKATFKNGKLTVVLPKTKEAKEKTKKIPITH